MTVKITKKSQASPAPNCVEESIGQVYDQAPLNVRLVRAEETERWNRLVEKHHYLKNASMVGESLRYVAEQDGQWVALLGWSSAAFHVQARDRFIGWSAIQRQRRRHLLACNARFVLLGPKRKVANLASQILSLNLRQLSRDWRQVYGHPIVAVETFVDPKRFAGTCYQAANWKPIGTSKGFGRSRLDFYQLHKQPKVMFLYPIYPKAFEDLRAEELPKKLARYETEPKTSDFLLNGEQCQSLIQAFQKVPDPRHRTKKVHRNGASILAIATVAMLAGNNTFLAIGEFSQDLNQNQLRCLRATRDRKTRRYLAPSESAIRRYLQRVDPDKLDQAIQSWISSHLSPDSKLKLAIDGKTVRAASKASGRSVHLFAALFHGTGLTARQIQIPEKKNEIPCVKELVADLDLENTWVSLDALHAQKTTSRYLVEEKKASCLVTVKANQPTLQETLLTLTLGQSFPPSGPNARPRAWTP